MHALIESGQVWQQIVDGDIYFARGYKGCGKKLFDYGDMKAFKPAESESEEEDGSESDVEVKPAPNKPKKIQGLLRSARRLMGSPNVLRPERMADSHALRRLPRASSRRGAQSSHVVPTTSSRARPVTLSSDDQVHDPFFTTSPVALKYMSMTSTQLEEIEPTRTRAVVLALL